MMKYLKYLLLLSIMLHLTGCSGSRAVNLEKLKSEEIEAKYEFWKENYKYSKLLEKISDDNLEYFDQVIVYDSASKFGTVIFHGWMGYRNAMIFMGDVDEFYKANDLSGTTIVLVPDGPGSPHWDYAVVTIIRVGKVKESKVYLGYFSQLDDSAKKWLTP